MFAICRGCGGSEKVACGWTAELVIHAESGSRSELILDHPIHFLAQISSVIDVDGIAMQTRASLLVTWKRHIRRESWFDGLD
jgi:hypothetical protein